MTPENAHLPPDRQELVERAARWLADRSHTTAPVPTIIAYFKHGISGSGSWEYSAPLGRSDLFYDAPFATSGVATLVGVETSGRLVNLPTDATNSDFRTTALFTATLVPALVMSVTVAGYHEAGDGGGHRKVRISTPSPVQAWHSQSADGAWWELSEVETSPRMFGAKDDGTDASAAIAAALDYGKLVRLDGIFTCLSQITHSGGARIKGQSKNTSGIVWDASTTSVGIKITPSSIKDIIFLEDFRVEVECAVASSKVIDVDWSGLTVANFDYFVTKFYAQRLHLEATGTGKFDRGFNLTYVHMGCIEHCYVQNQPSFGSTLASYSGTTACIYFDNDETTGNTATFHVEGCELFAALNALYVKDIEGFWLTGNDMQACWNGAHFHNGYRKINQIRVHGNHIGVYNEGLYIFNNQQSIVSDNEFSYATGRTDTATVHYITLEQCQALIISGNNIRGNYLTSPGTITLEGIYLFGTSGDVTSAVQIHGNNFRDLHTMWHIGANCSNIMPSDNSYRNILGTYTINDVGAAVNGTVILGSGLHQPISGQSLALFLSNVASGALGVNRDTSDGAVAAWYRDRAIVGSIAVSTTGASYNTSSDYRLKISVSPLALFTLSEDDFLAVSDSIRRCLARRPVSYEWIGHPELGLHRGYLAHELQQVNPNAVTGDKDAMLSLGDIYDADGSVIDSGVPETTTLPGADWRHTHDIPVYQQVDHSKLVPDIDAALQSAILMIMDQQRQITALCSEMASLKASLGATPHA